MTSSHDLEDADDCERKSTIEQSVQDALEHSSYSPIRTLECEFNDGRLTLHGQVPTYFMKQVAIELAKAAGGNVICNQLVVVQQPS